VAQPQRDISHFILRDLTFVDRKLLIPQLDCLVEAQVLLLQFFDFEGQPRDLSLELLALSTVRLDKCLAPPDLLIDVFEQLLILVLLTFQIFLGLL